MNYKEFLKYQESIPKVVQRFDDLNPFEIKLVPETVKQLNFTNWIKNEVGEQQLNFYPGKGIRNLIDEIFCSLREVCTSLVLPLDVYPVYQEIGNKYFNNFSFFETFPKLKLNLPPINNVILLIPNPLVPVGRILYENEIEQLNKWVTDGSNRFIIIDSCYNFKMKSIINKFEGNNVFELFSSSKLFLLNKTAGVAISKYFLKKWDYKIEEVIINPNMSFELDKKFQSTWGKFKPELLKIDKNWKVPEEGYLSTINCNYAILREKYNIGGIPASVFGSKEANISVISILSFLK